MPRPAANLHKPLILDGIRTEKELTSIITKIVDALIEEEQSLQAELNLHLQLPADLERLQWISELRIRLKEIIWAKRKVCSILKKSSNHLILATIELSRSIS